MKLCFAVLCFVGIFLTVQCRDELLKGNERTRLAARERPHNEVESLIGKQRKLKMSSRPMENDKKLTRMNGEISRNGKLSMRMKPVKGVDSLIGTRTKVEKPLPKAMPKVMPKALMTPMASTLPKTMPKAMIAPMAVPAPKVLPKMLMTPMTAPAIAPKAMPKMMTRPLTESKPMTEMMMKSAAKKIKRAALMKPIAEPKVMKEMKPLMKPIAEPKVMKEMKPLIKSQKPLVKSEKPVLPLKARKEVQLNAPKTLLTKRIEPIAKPVLSKPIRSSITPAKAAVRKQVRNATPIKAKPVPVEAKKRVL